MTTNMTPPILAIDMHLVELGKEDGIAAYHLDYQASIEALRSVTKFLQLLEQVQNTLCDCKSMTPDSFATLEDHPSFEVDFCRKRRQVRDYAAQIIGLVASVTKLPDIDFTGTALLKAPPLELLVVATYEFHEYMHDLFLVPLHAIDDALKQLKLDTQQIQTLATLRSSLEAAFEYCKAFCRDNKDAFDQVLNRR